MLRRPGMRPMPRFATLSLSVVVGLVAMLAVSFATPRPVAACSCAMLGSIKDYARPETVIVAGTVGKSEAPGLRFAVDTWFWGANPAPVVWLDHRSFGDASGDCTVRRPDAASALLVVGYRDRPIDPLSTGMCSPMVDLRTDDGQRQLADARLAFGAGLAQVPPEASDMPPPPGDATRTQALVTTAGGILVIVVALFGVVVVLARRREPRS